VHKIEKRESKRPSEKYERLKCGQHILVLIHDSVAEGAISRKNAKEVQLFFELGNMGDYIETL